VQGTATSEGTLTRSADGRYLTLGGYDAAPGTAAVRRHALGRRAVSWPAWAPPAPSTPHRAHEPTAGGNIRAVATDDGSRFWTAGSTGGVRLATAGHDDDADRRRAANARTVGIAAGQLYVGSASGAHGVSSVGTGLPSSASDRHDAVRADRHQHRTATPARPQHRRPRPRHRVPRRRSAGLAKYSKAGDGSVDGARLGRRRASAASPARSSGRHRRGSTRRRAAARSSRTSTAPPSTRRIAATPPPIAGAAAQTAFRGVRARAHRARRRARDHHPARRRHRDAGRHRHAERRRGRQRPLSYQWFAGTAGTTTTPVGTDAPTFTTPR
jgi:hypothetical protein